jgi:hypothetical protein
MHVIQTLPGAWLQKTGDGRTAWNLSDDIVAAVAGAKEKRRVVLRAAVKAGCVVLREDAAATTRADTSDARRTIDEVAEACRSALPSDTARDAAIASAASAAKDVDWDVCRLAVNCQAVDLAALCDHFDGLDDEDEVRRSHVGASVVARACGSSDVEALQRLYLKLRFNAFPVDGGLALFERASALNHACAPNASLSFSRDGRHLSVVLGCDLKEGDEVRISYLSPRALAAPASARRAALEAGFLFRCACARCTSKEEVDVAVVDAAAEALTNSVVDDRLAHALSALSEDPLGASTPLLRADLRLLAAKALAKRDTAAAALLADDALRDLRMSLDADDPRVSAAAVFVAELERRR